MQIVAHNGLSWYAVNAADQMLPGTKVRAPSSLLREARSLAANGAECRARNRYSANHLGPATGTTEVGICTVEPGPRHTID